MSFVTHVHVTRIAAMPIIFTCIGCTLLTRAYVKRMKDNEMRHVIHDTIISSGQCPRRDVTVRYGLQGHTQYIPEERHIHVKIIFSNVPSKSYYWFITVIYPCYIHDMTSRIVFTYGVAS
jgi:hypothetical protein